jgi:ATP-dependent exoDNAse (exonuclease V) beta subunit
MDRHAALYLLVTDLGRHSLQDAINELIETNSLEGEVLVKLKTVISGHKDRTVSSYISEIISALNLFETISEWPDADQARANLLRLIDEAKEFQTSKREILSSGGFYGSGLKTFLSWLAAKTDTEDEQPDPRVIDEESVQLFTWHRSKGKEWPVVAVCALESDYKEKLPSLNIDYENFTDLSSILNEARIQYSPIFSAPETNRSFINLLQTSNEKEARRLLYVALTRAREKLILEWPSHLDGKNGVTFYDLLRASTGISFDGEAIHVGQTSYACHVTQTSTSWPDGHGQSRHSLETPLPTSGRRAIELKDMAQELTPDTILPSNLEGTSDEMPGAPIIETYLDNPDFNLDLPGIERGTLLHRCFEILGSSSKKASLLERATQHPFTPDQIKALEIAVDSFESWLSDRFQPIQVGREVNFLSLNPAGSIVAGVIDLLVENELGYWIIDHKSDRTENLDSAFAYYWPQIDAYAQSIFAAHPEKPVLGAAINWISHGNVMLIELDK